jgi:hypothetical protein
MKKTQGVINASLVIHSAVRVLKVQLMSIGNDWTARYKGLEGHGTTQTSALDALAKQIEKHEGQDQ